MSISHTILDYVLSRAEGVRTSDATDDERFDAAASIVQGGVREALCVPLQGRYGIVGAIYIDTFTSPGDIVRKGSTHRFSDEHLRLITAIGHQAALAIEDTFYYSALSAKRTSGGDGANHRDAFPSRQEHPARHSRRKLSH